VIFQIAIGGPVVNHALGQQEFLAALGEDIVDPTPLSDLDEHAAK
jgi:hypothetical protein